MQGPRPGRDLRSIADEAGRRRGGRIAVAGPAEVGLSPRGTGTLEHHVRPLTAVSGGSPFGPGDVIVAIRRRPRRHRRGRRRSGPAHRPTLVLLGRSPAPAPEPDWLAAADRRGRDQARTGHASQRRRHAADDRRTISPADSPSAKCAGRWNASRRPARRCHLSLPWTSATRPRRLRRSAAVRAELRSGARPGPRRRRAGRRPHRGQDGGAIRARLLAPRSTGCATSWRRWRRTTCERWCCSRRPRAGSAGRGRSITPIANEVLNKTAQQPAALLPHCRVVSVNWGPWDGGMVTPALKKLLRRGRRRPHPPRSGCGISRSRAEPAADPAVEVAAWLEWTSRRGGRRLAHSEAGQRRDWPATRGASRPRGLRGLATAFERVLDLADHPVLESHVLDGRPVLPLALIAGMAGPRRAAPEPRLDFPRLRRSARPARRHPRRPARRRCASWRGKAVKQRWLLS